MPKRIQRKRTKGWRMPENCVSVTRPGSFGNPFVVGEEGPMGHKPIDAEGALGFFRAMFGDEQLRAAAGYPSNTEIRDRLCGKDLACYCPLDKPCHADVLLELANA
ncbi:MAG: DUF4326 domain-containing protein [Pirellulales bacterium]